MTVTELDPHRETRASKHAIATIHASLMKVFRRQQHRAIAAVGRLTKARVFKAEEDDSSDYDRAAFAEAINEDVFEEWRRVPSEVMPALEHAMLSGINTAILQLELHSTGLIAAANNIAAKFAEERAAELVGMKYDAEGYLVPNPKAEWAISDTTRDKIRRIVTEAFESETSIARVEDKIKLALEEDGAGIFTDARATMIAQTEVAHAQAGGNWRVWKDSGLVHSVKWTVSALEPCDECAMNKNVEVDLGEKFPSGDIMPPIHPACRCVLVAVRIGDDE